MISISIIESVIWYLYLLLETEINFSGIFTCTRHNLSTLKMVFWIWIDLLIMDSYIHILFLLFLFNVTCDRFKYVSTTNKSKFKQKTDLKVFLELRLLITHVGLFKLSLEYMILCIMLYYVHNFSLTHVQYDIIV